MNRKQIGKIVFTAFLILASLACSVSYKPKEQNQNTGDNSQPDSDDKGLQLIPEVPQIFEKPVVEPVGLNKGLASLNSYTYSMQTIFNGPTANDRNETKVTTSYTSNGENSMTKTESFSSSADEPQGNRSVSTIYKVGNKTCTVEEGAESDSSADAEDISPAAKEMLKIFSNLADVVINVDNPQKVGSEVINGINCNHFTFNVGGLGSSSGAEVTQSSGAYWSAMDGNYLVKYDVVLETRSAPESSSEAEVLHAEVHYSLYDINAAINITLPAGCN